MVDIHVKIFKMVPRFVMKYMKPIPNSLKKLGVGCVARPKLLTV